ncbi:SEC14-like protein 2 [Copidosoma floridanum]|uniref:SEC14-like protein 2 n=1 Tax=Copidosoma floridanum TaxID=29053 RepID=UPI0006C9CABE|nr:SEC14-like protein 2 [Copidosoma floridanum]
MTPSLKLADDQRFALMKLRRSVQDVLQPYHDDHFLLRWLRARKWDAAAAEKMLRDSLAWRKRWDVDQLQEWEEPKILREYLPHGLSGFDKDGAPVIIVPFAGLDLYGILHVVSRKEMIKMTVKKLEGYLQICREQSEKFGPDAGQCTVIFDMENFNLRPFMWRPAGELIIALIQMYEANYPEILKICYMINAPKVFAFAFSIAKKFMNEYTISKIQIYKSDPNKWKNAVLKMIPEEQLPVHFGGKLADPDGNPRYTSKICQGGKVPKNQYKNKGDAERNDEFTTATIKKGDKLKLDFKPDEVGSLLSWEFHLDEHDIKFGVVRRGNDGSQKEIIPVHRVSPQQSDEVGLVTCDIAPAIYSVVFDNSYSLLRNKKIHYCIRMVPPSALDESTLVSA